MRTLLLVDDEPGIRETLPHILRLHDFDVTTAACVPEALNAVMTRRFDVLISDLNIGEPGDGFTVVSAMRRVQPDCRTFIITGFPAFETALVAIRTQVDDYIVKPANIPSLIDTINRSLQRPKSQPSLAGKRIAEILREHNDEIVEKALERMKADTELRALPLQDKERVDHIPKLLAALAEMLDSMHPDQTSERVLECSRARGKDRATHGYTIGLLIAETRLIVDVINDVIQENLLSINLSHVISDLKFLDDSILLQLEAAAKEFTDTERDLAA